MEFRMESTMRMERLEDNVEFLKKRLEELEAGREEDRVKLKKQVAERKRSAQKVVTSELDESRKEMPRRVIPTHPPPCPHGPHTHTPHTHLVVNVEGSQRRRGALIMG